MRLPIVFILLLVGCSTESSRPIEGPPFPRRAADPHAYYQGTFPCDDCPGIEYTMQLRGDGSYILRTVRLGSAATAVGFDELGRWAHCGDSNNIVLFGGSGVEVIFWIAPQGRLVLSNGIAARSPNREAFSLSRIRAPEAFVPKLQVRGFAVLRSEQWLFRECKAEIELPIATESSGKIAKLAATASHDTPLALALEARIVQAERGAANPTGEEIVIDRVAGTLPASDCSSIDSEGRIEAIRWYLTALDGKPVEIGSGDPPFVYLDPTNGRASGNGGCNGFGGPFQRNGSSIRFEQLGATRKWCSIVAIESAFLTALSLTREWRLQGNRLELLDSARTVVAELERRP